MSTAVQEIVAVLEVIVSGDESQKDLVSGLHDTVIADEEKEEALEARVTALESSAGTGGSADLDALTARVATLEARNSADDGAAAGLPAPAPETGPVALALAPSALSDAEVGVPYSANLSVSGSAALPFAFSILSGNLPDGLTMAPGGLISGTPTVAGSFGVQIQAHDTNGATGSISYTMVVDDPAAAPAPEPAPVEA